MRGVLVHACTRIYFSDDASVVGKDSVLATVTDDRRKTLVAERTETADGIVYRWDIRMQGDAETVFFDA